MELRQLATFRMVAETGSFTRAAERLGYVQSNVTAHIRALEDEFAVVLFDRLGRRVQLTSAGQRLLDYAGRLLTLADEAQAAVAEDAGSLVQISSSDTLCAYRLPAVLRHVRAELPQARVVFRPMPMQHLRQQVLAGEIDVAFMMEDVYDTPGLRVEPLAVEEIVLVAPPDHALALSAAVLSTDLAGVPMLLTEAGCAYRVRFEQVMLAAKTPLHEPMEFNSTEAIKQCVMAGMGVAVLPGVTVADEVARGELARLAWAGPDLNMTTQMIWNTKRWSSPTLTAFLALARRVLMRE